MIYSFLVAAKGRAIIQLFNSLFFCAFLFLLFANLLRGKSLQRFCRRAK